MNTYRNTLGRRLGDCLFLMLCIYLPMATGVVLADSVMAGSGAGPARAIQADAFTYEVGPIPAFVELRQQSGTGLGRTARVDKNLRIILLDRQISLLDAQPKDYLRLVMQPLDSQGVREASQLIVLFNPEYQRLKVHGVRVIRDGKVLDRTAGVTFDLLRREQNLEQQVYEGQVTAVGVLSDIRVNDTIEFDYTIEGANPIFGGRHSSVTALSINVPIDELRFRLLHPESRQITVRAPAFATGGSTLRSGVVHQEWVARGLRAVLDEKDRPRWHDNRQWMEASEFADWKDVGRWAEELFTVPGELDPGLKQQIAGWKSTHPSQAALAALVLRWVQSEIRYFGIEIGTNSHKPSHPNLTYARRFGDCKDKSLLLATLLNELGIPARPALVSLEQNRAIENRQPMPFAFDHAIVRAQVDGRTYWLDPSRPPQYGSLEDMSAHDYGRALVIGASETGLSAVGYPAGYTNRVELVDRYVVHGFREPVELEETFVAYRSDAEQLRQILASLPKADFSRLIQADKLRIHPNATVIEEPQVTDDRETNRFTVVNRYRIPDLFDYEPGRFSVNIPDLMLLSVVKLPDVPDRETPMGLSHPFEARHEVVFELPENPIRNVPPPEVKRTRWWESRSQIRADAKTLRTDKVVKSLRDHVSVPEMRGYLADVQDLRQHLGVSLGLKVAETPKSEREVLARSLSKYDRYGKSRSDALQAQIDAEVMIRQIGHDIASGRLNDKQLAHAYAERALHRDHQDNVNDAVRDINQAIQLAPAEAAYKLSKARILTRHGQFQEALEIFEHLEREGLGHEFKQMDLFGFGEAHFYLGQHEQAARRFDQAAGQSGRTGTLIAAFWRHLSSLITNNEVPSKLEQLLASESDRDWPYAVGEMLLGRMSPDDLREAARSGDLGIERDQLCEAYFYIGQKYLIEGNKDKAGEYFEKAVDLNVVPYLEHKFAKLELKRLGNRPGGLLKWLRDL